MSTFGQFAATSQFYLYGRSHCTKTGWQEHVKHYEKPDILEDKKLSLLGKKYMITGANAGVGREITKFLASKGASVYMVCRNPERANKARDEIVAETGNTDVKVLLCDCSLEADVRRMWTEYCSLVPSPQLDGLVCNAGLLANEKTLTSEGVEITLAVHLLFGTYLLGQLAMPYLEATEGSRVIAVSSGGMYNTKFPAWDIASSTGKAKYDGQFSYAYAKRGQVLLMEQWTVAHPKVKFVSSHPGWVQTEAVDAAYGANKSYLEPLRNTWEGSEGIIWLLVEAVDKIQGGGFYLDRK
jgi:dehydrogenase/reductase SDR family protein 12